MRLAMAIVFVSVASTASAQLVVGTTDRASAQSLFDEGLVAYDVNDWETACAKFAASQALDPSAMSLLWMARCAEREGHFAEAWSLCADARTANIMSNVNDDLRSERALEITKLREKLEPLLGSLIIHVVPVPPGLVVTRDDKPVPVPALGEPLLLDPGDVVLHAHAPGFAPLAAPVKVSAGTHASVTLTLVPLEPEPERFAEGGAPTAPRSSSLVVGGWSLIGAGIALSAAALGTGIAAGVESALSDEECVDVTCTPDGLVLRKQAGALEIVAWTLGGAAAATAAIGVPLVVVGGGGERHVSLNVGPSWIRLGVTF